MPKPWVSGWFVVNANDVTEKIFLFKPPRSQSKNFSELRLNPAQLNNLNLAYLVRFAAEFKYTLAEGFVETGNTRIRTYFKHLTKNHALDFVVFQTVCDIENPYKINNLAFINEVINSFKKKHLEYNGKLLIPLNQSRLGKRHSVLLEVNLQARGQIKNLTLHNSQSKWGSLFYPNCLNDLDVSHINLQYYQKQTDEISCGFFVYFYIKSILENKDSNQLKNIFVTLKALVSNPTLLEDTINQNLSNKYPDARKISASGEGLSWESSVLEQQLDKVLSQKIDATSFDFPEYTEGSEENIVNRLSI